MRLLKQLGAVLVVTAVGSVALGAVDGSWLPTLVLGFVAAALALLTYGWVVRRTERRAVTELGRAGAGSTTLRGVALGVTMFAVVIACITLTGGYRVDGWGSVSFAVGFLGFTAAAAVTEELMFRGVLFRVVEERAGTWGALALTAVVFGAMHLINPHATVWGAIAIAIEAGGMLGAAYAATRTLWLPIGLHVGWNFAAAGIFGTEVSGNDTPQGLLEGVTSGPALLSGGAFGPEGSLFAVLAGAALMVVFLRLAHKRGRIVPARGRADRTPATASV